MLRHCCSIQPFISLVVSTTIGVLLCIAVSDLVYPWYTSAAASQTLSSAYSSSLQLMKGYCEALYCTMEVSVAACVQCLLSMSTFKPISYWLYVVMRRLRSS